MSKYIRQLRYYGEDDSRNYPQNDPIYGNISLNQLINAQFFAKYMPISQIGIQTMPGVKFYINDDIKATNGIIIGYTGTYELNLEGIAEINSLRFDQSSIDNIKNIPDAYLIIDMVCEGG